jgi:hypothetical protein
VLLDKTQVAGNSTPQCVPTTLPNPWIHAWGFTRWVKDLGVDSRILDALLTQHCPRRA